MTIKDKMTYKKYNFHEKYNDIDTEFFQLKCLINR